MRFDRRDFLALAGASALFGCGGTSILACPEPAVPGTWNNAVRSLEVLRPGLLAYPASAGAVIELVRAAEAMKQRVRMTGSGHSFSDVALTDDVLLLPNLLSQPLTLDRARLKPQFAGDRHLVRVQGGMTIRELNSWLDSRCLALTNLGGYDAQTITGVAMTATHGSGRAYGPIVSQIASLQLVTTGGNVRQIEPANGITDPTTFPGSLEEDPNIPVTLVQDDDEFNAVSVSMGSMGVVTAVVLKTVDKFWLRERRRPCLWSELSKPGGYLDTLVHRADGSGYPDHVEIYINPYETRKGDHRCVLTERYRLLTPPKPTPDNVTSGPLGEGDIFNDSRFREIAQDFLRAQLNNAKVDQLERILSTQLDFLVDNDYTAESYKVFNIGAINLLRVIGIELAFPIEQTIAVTNEVFAQAKKEAQKRRHHSAPFSLRFVKAASPYLAMQNGRDTLMLEMGLLVAAHQSRELLADYEQFFIEQRAARPHWGLDMSVLTSFAQVQGLYGKAADDWLRVYQRLNSAGTFDGRFTDRLGISMRPKG